MKVRNSAFAALSMLALFVTGCASGAGSETIPAPSVERKISSTAERQNQAAFGLERKSEVIGKSALSEPIEAVTLGSGARTMVVIGGLHTGVEAETVEIVEDLLAHYEDGDGQLPLGVRIVFIPEVNPDGLTLEQRVNANGVDLNRNFPTKDWAEWAIHGESEVYGGPGPLSEPESQALYDFLVELQPDFVLTIHGYAGVVHHNDVSASRAFGRAFGAAAGFDVIDEWTDYEITGELIEALAEEDIPAADVELIESDRDSFERVVRGVNAVLGELARRATR